MPEYTMVDINSDDDDREPNVFYFGPDMCIFCYNEVTENHCWNCDDYKGIVDFDTYYKMGL